MRFRSMLLALVAALSALMLAMTPASAAVGSHAPSEPPQSASATEVAPAALSCQTYYVCFYSQTDYGGQRCMWSGDDPDWRAGAITCSWSGSYPVRSAYNQGTSGLGVLVFTGTNYTGSSICITRYTEVRNIYIWARSHKWAVCGK